MVTVEPNGTDADAQQWLGIRTEPERYCEECGNLEQFCECKRDEEGQD